MKCPAGTYSNPSSTMCTNCPLGHYSPLEGSDKCLECEPGTYAGYFRSKICNKCPAGTYSHNKGAISCSSCLPGQTSNIGAISCYDCPAGTHSSGGYGSTECIKCKPGQYSSKRTNTACYSCPAGTFSDITLTKCNKCRPGTYSNEGSSVCTVWMGAFHYRNSSRCLRCGHWIPARKGECPVLFSEYTERLLCLQHARNSSYSAI